MCGLFGFVATPGQTFNIDRLARIAEVTQRRGPHAFGFAWVDARGRLKMFKRTGKISDYIGCLAMAHDARMLIGHCRYATHGSPSNNLNNHPFACDGGWLVHNGVIHQHEELNEGYMLSPTTQCDSETLALLVEELDGTMLQRVAKAAKLCGGAPLATMALWRNPLRMVVLRSGTQPLHTGSTREGTYLASLPGGLPGVRKIRDERALEYRIRDGKIATRGLDLGAVDVTA
ncbi:Glutamine--fructose-6-phosphate aminotransferase [isomerizing] [Pirellulimonas nuda]|uniref:Glutamine--fructose-6-phosphate aminotransferase [isomerizing] n=1 Tax=Pirellulimonas nuda TaxID=2528009 RepID=A0A518DA72_9BACT|nr:hypothetical protein [Pirellulimonas nuda]QDU88385.1 Glutamine--fructose-6-phosphate aminotransferase [isomerizing] [Pirellulimonas nuda]